MLQIKELNIKFYNSYSPVKNENQKIQNNKNKEDLEILIKDICQKEPLFCQIEITHVNNEKIVENCKTYLVEYELIEYFDLNKLKIYKNEIKREEIKEKEKEKNIYPLLQVKHMFVMLNKIVNGNLKHTKEKGNEKYSKTIQNKIGAKLRGVGGLVLGGLGGWLMQVVLLLYLVLVYQVQQLQLLQELLLVFLLLLYLS